MRAVQNIHQFGEYNFLLLGLIMIINAPFRPFFQVNGYFNFSFTQSGVKRLSNDARGARRATNGSLSDTSARTLASLSLYEASLLHVTTVTENLKVLTKQ